MYKPAHDPLTCRLRVIERLFAFYFAVLFAFHLLITDWQLSIELPLLLLNGFLTCYLIFVYGLWTNYRLQTIRREKNRKTALAQAVFFAFVGFGLSLVLIPGMTIQANFFKLEQLLQEEASTGNNWYWYRFSLFRGVGIGTGLLFIYRAIRGPSKDTAGTHEEAVEEKLNQLAERVVPHWSEHSIKRIDQLLQDGLKESAAFRYKEEYNVPWEQADIDVLHWETVGVTRTLEAILSHLDARGSTQQPTSVS